MPAPECQVIVPWNDVGDPDQCNTPGSRIVHVTFEEGEPCESITVCHRHAAELRSRAT